MAKVFQEVKPKEFEPITIVLETKEEASLMWYLLFISNTLLLNYFEYSPKRKAEVQELLKERYTTFYHIWSDLDDIHKPRERAG